MNTPDELLAPSAESLAEQSDDADCLRLALSGLTQRQADVIELRYGITNGRDYTQHETAMMLGITRQMVSLHEQAALKRLRAILGALF